MKLTTIILLSAVSVCSGQYDDQQFVLRSSLPDEINYNQQNKSFFEKYLLSEKPNPFYLRGDFNGDGNQDYAISVVNRSNGKRGVAVFFSHTNYEIIAAGMPLLEDGRHDDLWYIDAWSVYSKREVELGVGETEEITLTAEAILAIKTESSSGIIYWDGKKFRWYQQGD